MEKIHEKANILHEDAMEGRLFLPWAIDTVKLVKDIGVEETDTIESLPTPPGMSVRTPREMGVLKANQGGKEDRSSKEKREEENRVIAESTQTAQEWMGKLAEQFSVHHPKETYASFLEDVFRNVQDIAAKEEAKETKEATDDVRRGSTVSKSTPAEEDDEVTFNIKPKRKARTAASTTASVASAEGQESQDTGSVASNEDNAASSERGKPPKRSTRSQNPQHFFQRLRQGGKSSQKK